MALGRLSQQGRWSLIAVVFHLLLLLPSFVLWAPWNFAISTARAAEQYPGQVDPNWRAVQVNHGRPSEWRWGTMRENPLGYAACSAVFAVSLAGFLYSLNRAKRASGEASHLTSG